VSCGCWVAGEGARRSVRVPVRRRVAVLERAMMETWVAGEVEEESKRWTVVGGGERDLSTVPMLLMKASPGPIIKKKPKAKSHMV